MNPAHQFIPRLGALLFAGLFSAALQAGDSPASIQFNRDIRPILSENCFACHGVDSAARKAGLRLDRFEDAIAPAGSGQPAIVPGNPDASEFIHRITTDDSDDLMPPPGSHKVLTQEQKELLARWIAEGAKYEPHWALVAPVHREPPPVRNSRWVRNPIDNFILARLEKEGLDPAPEADRRALARRMSLDLTGLPPAPEEVEHFVRDKSAEAYENFVDRLLASPHWGEHRGRYWLDAARYGDTHGIHIDNFREIWAYRDWVINAFNSNQPFDQFSIEQLAGDLLPDPTMEQKIATGLNRCNITTSEGGAINEEYLVLYTQDRTETTAQVWLGLTASCAACHDHKYDDFSQREFYELSAFFNNTTQKAMDGNVKDTPPVIVVPTSDDRARWEALPPELTAARQRIEQRRETTKPDFEEWLASGEARSFSVPLPGEEMLLHALLADDHADTIAVNVAGESRTLAIEEKIKWQEGAIASKAFTTNKKTVPEIADAGDFERDQSFSIAAWVRLTDDLDGSIVARMNEDDAHRGWDLWFEGGKPGTHIVHNWPENAIKVVAKEPLKANRWTHVVMTYDGSSKAGGVRIYVDGQLQGVDRPRDGLKDSIRTEVPLKIGQRQKGAPMERAGIQDLRLYGRVLESGEAQTLATVSRLQWLSSKAAEERTDIEGEELFTRWLPFLDEEFQNATAALADLVQEESDIKVRGTIAHIARERDEPAHAYVLFRGEYDQRRDRVEPGTPAVLPPLPSDFPRNRLGFAQWLFLPEHPLTARVTVNRFWQELFGNGLVATSGDFGVSGEMPSHPELLDWLALEFRDSGWDVKRFFKLLVTSATYRQAAIITPEKLAGDPGNRLLSRGPRFRMDAEMVRDHALASSGLLVPKIGGPSVKPYQPEGVWEAVAMPNSDTSQYKRDTGEKLYRRSVYTFWKRSAPPASMDVFNAPSRETCTVRRERTNTPLQALATLNDEQMIEAARHLAQRALQEGGFSTRHRLDFMARQLLARPLHGNELRIVDSVLQSLIAHYRSAPEDAAALISVGESEPDLSVDSARLAAYTMVANQLMNLDEVLNK